MPVSFEHLNMVNVHDVVQIDILKNADNTVIYGFRGVNGVIAIYTKKGTTNNIVDRPFHIKTVLPLGYQKPVEFYAPKYDTPAQNTKPGLRTTIHWQPNITTDENGTASFSFYTADAPATYTVVIEGITEDGKIVYKRDKIVVMD